MPKKNLQAYRVVVGYNMPNGIKRRSVPVVYHMTFYAADPVIRDFLILSSGCENGQIYLADMIDDNVPIPFSAN